MKAKVTISISSNDIVNISITDKTSNLLVTRISMTPHDFAMAIGGNALMPAEFESIPNEFIIQNIGKKRETIGFSVEKKYSKEEQIKCLIDSFNKSINPSEGWTIFDDGTNSQQNGKLHKAILYRFVDVD